MLDIEMKRWRDPWTRFFGFFVLTLILAALPLRISSIPVSSAYTTQGNYPQAYQPPPYEPTVQYQSSYTPSYEQSYEPSYQQTYTPPYEPTYSGYPAQQSYEQSYPQQTYTPSYPEPSYQTFQPTYEQAYPQQQNYEPYPQQQTYQQPSYPEQTYTPSYEPSYKPVSYPEQTYEAKPTYYPSYTPTYKTEYYPEYVNYEAITYRELNESIHCGVIPAVNSELYKNSYGGYQYEPEYGYGKTPPTNVAVTTTTLPFGKSPWSVLITDDYNNILCQGSIVHTRFILTLTSCVESYALHKLRVRFGDWDILNNANEYEAYKNVEARICKKIPLTCPYASTYAYGNQQKSDQSTGLSLLLTEFQPLRDVYPQVRPVCLPEYYHQPTYQPTYPTNYQPQQQQQSNYQPQQQSNYQPQQTNYPPANPQPAYTPSYKPPASYAPAPYAPPPTYYKPTVNYYSDCYVAGYYGSPTTKLQNHKRPIPYDNYGYQTASYPQTSAYSSYPESYESKIPKVAKVKEIKCESYNAYKKPNIYGEESCEENMCFVGVDGDACVGDYGSAIVCLVSEKESYDPGYSYYGKDQPQVYGSATPNYAYPQNPYYKKEIRATEAQEKVERKRAAIVAIVEYPAQCSSGYKTQKGGYGYQTEDYQSKPIVAIKVTSKVVHSIQVKYFQGVQDHSCPALTTYYETPTYSPQPYPTPSYPTPSYPTPSYPTPSYPTPSYPTPSYPTPTYPQPSYPQQSYPQPSYPQPSYPSPTY